MRSWLLGLLCIVPMVAGASAPWPGVSWPDVGGGGTTDNYTIGTWYAQANAFWTFGSNPLCITTQVGSGGVWLCDVYEEQGIPFSSPNGINVVDLTCAFDPTAWGESGKYVELEVAIHQTSDSDDYGTATGVNVRLLSDATAPTVVSSGDATYTSSITSGYITLQTNRVTNTWTTGTVEAICSIEVN